VPHDHLTLPEVAMKRTRDGEPEPAAAENGSPGPSDSGGAPAGSSGASRVGATVRGALARLPSAEMYERSYMHRDWVTHVLVTRTDFVATASRDGQLKFWKKMPRGIEFVKHFRAHMKPFAGLAASPDGSLLASTSADRGLKVFDVLAFDMIAWIKLDFTPGVCEWVGGAGAGAHANASSRTLLAVADADSPEVRLLDAASGEGTPLHTVRVHSAPVLLLRFNPAFGAVVSADARGVLEYWSATEPFGLPAAARFQFKTETDLYAVAKARARPLALAVSPDGEHFAVCASDLKVRLFSFRTGKTRRTYDESSESLHALQKDGDDAYRLEAFDFGRRMAVEREYRASPEAPPANVVFDSSGQLLLFASVVGVKVVAFESSTLVRLLGKVENTERFCHLALFQGRAALSANLIGSGAKVDEAEDPTLLCCSFKRSRFFLFTSREPLEPEGDDAVGRDVFNEKPSADDLALAQRDAKGPLPRLACINTSYGEVHVKLFPDECPKTVENFTTHARQGYYDGVLFHRVIKGFMCQTGDPLGDGTGGTSIWGREE